MGLTQYHHGVPFVVAISFAVWLGLNASTTCFSAIIVEGYDIPPDARLGGCDSIFTRALRTLTGDTERKPFYDIIYNVNFSFVWVFGIVFAVWYLWRRRSMTNLASSPNEIKKA